MEASGNLLRRLRGELQGPGSAAVNVADCRQF